MWRPLYSFACSSKTSSNEVLVRFFHALILKSSLHLYLVEGASDVSTTDLYSEGVFSAILRSFGPTDLSHPTFVYSLDLATPAMSSRSSVSIRYNVLANVSKFHPAINRFEYLAFITSVLTKLQQHVLVEILSSHYTFHKKDIQVVRLKIEPDPCCRNSLCRRHSEII